MDGTSGRRLSGSGAARGRPARRRHRRRQGARAISSGRLEALVAILLQRALEEAGQRRERRIDLLDRLGLDGEQAARRAYSVGAGKAKRPVSIS